MPTVAVVTGSLGMIGAEAALFYGKASAIVVGVDNDLRRYFFGPEASTLTTLEALKAELGTRYRHHHVDIRDRAAIKKIFNHYGNDIELIIHAAAQPSHDWAGQEPVTDFSINATGTLNLLEAMREHCPDAVFTLMSTNKVYGDNPNRLPLIEEETRWSVERSHPYARGIPEEMSIDCCLHSLFGVSKTAGDLAAQEYARYFGCKTGIFRAGVVSGPRQLGAQLHGFLSYLIKCAVTGTPYCILGYKGKQVRDIIHAADVIAALDAFFRAPRRGEVYNLGGGQGCNISVLEAVRLVEDITETRMHVEYSDTPRRGDHIWYVSDVTKLETHFPGWIRTYPDVRSIAEEVFAANRDRWAR